jgi:NAD(P)-dependent dehydrogenase (short-subunit alcohol dehydrogenase family)
MNKPVTLVTGASRGIGRAVCVQLAAQGHHIIALARTVGALEDLADEIGDDNITLIPQDF